MKCPKCGYLGFETTDRCRHCGYDFSLSSPVAPSSELSIRPGDEAEAPLADLDLGTNAFEHEPLDLDRVIGDAQETPATSSAADTLTVDASQGRPPSASAVGVATPPALPLFSGSSDAKDEPRITAPRPAGPPLAVRRATPEIVRRRTPRTLRREDDDLSLQLEPPRAAESKPGGSTVPAPQAIATAHPVARMAAALLDAALLGTMNVIVLYLTLAITGLDFKDVLVVPAIPMATFLLLLTGGYLVAFTAANGQTLGKMATHVRVIGDHGNRVDVAGAVLRAAGVLVTALLLGVPYLAIFASSDRRALHDRLAGTRVVKGA